MGVKRNVERRIKCVIWDLDNTLWEGVLTEGGGRKLRDGAEDTLRELDRRGILLSIVSHNDYDAAMKRLSEFGIADLFLAPQINWGPKSESVAKVIEDLNLKALNIAFIDDSEYQRDEVKHAHPDITVYDETEVASLPDYGELQVKFITEDSARRRIMYKADMERNSAHDSFDGTDEAFLKTLNMRLHITCVDEEQLKRVEELTVRTHQLNSTGYTYSYDELKSFIDSDKHEFLIAGLEDVYGDSGKVGLVLMEDAGEYYVLKLLIVSCRVMTRGVGGALLTHAIRVARKAGKPLRAEYLETEYNRIMYITYKLAGFDEISQTSDEKGIVMEYSKEEIPKYPSYMTILSDE